MMIFSRRKYIGREHFPAVVNALASSFALLREEYFLGSMMQLKREGIDVLALSRDIVPGSELEDALKGFQLMSMAGVAREYIKDARAKDDFNIMLSSQLEAQHGSRAWNYRERYVDFQGNMDALCPALAADIHRALDYPEPRQEFIIQFQGGARILIGLCQEAACKVCGDNRRAQELRKQALSYIG